jgi:hypothetical protein
MIYENCIYRYKKNDPSTLGPLDKDTEGQLVTSIKSDFLADKHLPEFSKLVMARPSTQWEIYS